jgi:hypothetical protein
MRISSRVVALALGVLLLAAKVSASTCAMEIQSQLTPLSPEIRAMLVNPSPLVPGCADDAPRLDVNLRGEFADEKKTRFSATFNLVLGPTIEARSNKPGQPSTISNLLSSFSGRVFVGEGSTAREWTAQQANFGPLFAKTLLKDDELNVFLPVKLQPASSSADPIFAAIKLGCALKSDAVVCSTFSFLFESAAEADRPVVAKVKDFCPSGTLIASGALLGARPANSAIALQPGGGGADCCLSAHRCGCCECLDSQGNPTQNCPGLCSNCQGHNKCNDCLEFGCDSCTCPS